MPKRNKTHRRHPNTIQALARGIYAKRKSKGISQYELSDCTGLTRNCIQQMECHEHLPRLETIFEIMLELDFNEEEAKEFLWNCLEAYRKDKKGLQYQEKELAGVL